MIVKRRWPWIAQQNWRNILFIHTPVTYETIRYHVPYPFDVDLYNGRAWVSIVLFRATHSRLRFMLPFLSFPPFYQINIRTYVRFGNERGVYFFTIHAGNRMVRMGGDITGLPFRKANMIIKGEEDRFTFKANQLFGNPQSEICLTYEPKTYNITRPYPDSLPYFLSERYAIWMIRNDTIVKAPIFHTHWNVKKAEVTVHEWKHIPFPITDDTIAYYARFKHAFIHPFERVGRVDYGME